MCAQALKIMVLLFCSCAATSPPVYLGCFTDCGKAVPQLLSMDGPMTPQLCAELAAERSLAYFGLQNGEECWGSNDYSRAVIQGASEQCTTPCSGDNEQTCGESLGQRLRQLLADIPHLQNAIETAGASSDVTPFNPCRRFVRKPNVSGCSR